MKKIEKKAPKTNKRVILISTVIGFVFGLAFCIPALIDDYFCHTDIVTMVIKGPIFGIFGGVIGLVIGLVIKLVNTKLEKWITKVMLLFTLFQLSAFVLSSFAFTSIRNMWQEKYALFKGTLPLLTRFTWWLCSLMNKYWYLIVPLTAILLVIEIFVKKSELKVMLYLAILTFVILLELAMLGSVAVPVYICYGKV